MTDTIQILIDGNACGYASHNMDPLTNTNGDQVQAVIGFLSTIAAMKKEFPTANMIVLWDGRSWRNDVLASYKESRDPDLSEFDTSKPFADEKEAKRYHAAVKKVASRAAYKKQGPWLKEAVSYLGIPQMTCGNYEADDLAALFTDRYVSMGHPVRLVTSDGDWMQLIQPRVVWKANRAPYTFVSTANFHEKAKVSKVTGFENPRTFLQAKLLAGDMGDCVPGIPGFGELTLGRFFAAYGDLETFFDLPLAKAEQAYRNVAGKAAPKCVSELHTKGMFCPELEAARTLMDLRTPNRPKPERINTERGAIDKPALLALTKRLDLYRLSSDIDRFVRTFEGA